MVSELTKTEKKALKQYILYLEGIVQDEGYDSGSKFTDTVSNAFDKLGSD